MTTRSILGSAITGLHPAIVVLAFIPLIPTASQFYAKKMSGKSQPFQHVLLGRVQPGRFHRRAKIRF